MRYTKGLAGLALQETRGSWVVYSPKRTESRDHNLHISKNVH